MLAVADQADAGSAVAAATAAGASSACENVGIAKMLNTAIYNHELRILYPLTML
jgi:tetrahydromethanopterin S-methyltransferase subunit A